MYEVIRKHPTARRGLRRASHRGGSAHRGRGRARWRAVPPRSTRASSKREASLGLIGNKCTVDWSRYAERRLARAASRTRRRHGDPAPARQRHHHGAGRLHAASADRAGCSTQPRTDGRGRAPIDWGMGEIARVRHAAPQGRSPCGSAGQDCGRGTFSHRHAIVHRPARRGRAHLPLQHLATGPAALRGVSIRSLSEKPCSASSTATRSTDAERAGDLGSAVRRLRQRRAGDHRPVHRLVRDEVGAPVRPRAAPAARLRRPGARALVARASSASCSCAPRTTCRSAMPTTPAQIFHMLRRQMLRASASR